MKIFTKILMYCSLFSFGFTANAQLSNLSFEYNFSNIDPNKYTFEEINCLPINGTSNDIYNVTQSQNVQLNISQETHKNDNILDGSLQMIFDQPSDEWIINKFMFGDCQPTILDLINTPVLNLTVKSTETINFKIAAVIVDGNSFFVNDTLGSVVGINLQKGNWNTITVDIPAFFGTQKVDLSKVLGIAFKVTSATSNNRVNPTSPTNLLIDQIKIENRTITNSLQKETQNFSIFPNPSSNIITINNLPNNTQINIFNTLGTSVKTSDDASLNISDLDKGIYFLQIVENNKVIHTEKIIKN